MEKNNSKRFKYGAASVLTAVIVIIIAIFVNLLVIKLDIQWDLTTNKIFTLNKTSVEFVKKLTKEVTVYGLYDNTKTDTGDQNSLVNELLKQYQNASSKVKVKFVDPDKDPAILTQLDPQKTKTFNKGDLVVACGKKFDIIPSTSFTSTQQTQMGNDNSLVVENYITTAIKRVSADKTPTIYFTTGHKERAFQTEYQQIKMFLEGGNFYTKDLDLQTAPRVPDDAELVFVLAPKIDLLPDEAKKLNDYLDKGGKMFFAFDPVIPNQNMPTFEKVLSNYNITLDYDKVAEGDKDKFKEGDPSNIMVSLESNALFGDVPQGQNLSINMPNSRSINILKTKKEGLDIVSLLKTSDKAIGVQADRSKGKDINGPLDLAVAAEYQGGTEDSRVVVIGNATVFSDASLVQQNANSLATSVFSVFMQWLIQNKDDMGIPPKSLNFESINVSQSSANIFAIILIGIIPLIIFGLGTFVWLRRRHL
ncbi:MAG: GldG family protein [Bacillota bacterium]|nr:GldG family protein [Bacillota bacterium]